MFDRWAGRQDRCRRYRESFLMHGVNSYVGTSYVPRPPISAKRVTSSPISTCQSTEPWGNHVASSVSTERALNGAVTRIFAVGETVSNAIQIVAPLIHIGRDE